MVKCSVLLYKLAKPNSAIYHIIGRVPDLPLLCWRPDLHLPPSALQASNPRPSTFRSYILQLVHIPELP